MDVKYAWFSSAVRAGDDPKSNFKNLGGKLTSNIFPREEFSMSPCTLDTPVYWRNVLFPFAARSLVLAEGIRNEIVRKICATRKLKKDVEGADALSFSATER